MSTARVEDPPPRLRGLLVDLFGVLADPTGRPTSMVDVVRRAGASGVATALVTDAVALPPAWEHLGRELFDTVVLAGTFAVGKPDPRVYRATADRLALPVGACVVVDDRPANLRGARRAGAVVVACPDEPGAMAAAAAEIELLLGLPAAT